MNQFQAPIPGQSLTTPPGNMPYERPPEISDPEEALRLHLKRLSKPEMQQDIADLLELNSKDAPMDVVTLTEGLLRSAVAEGIHSIDVSLIIAPVIHDYIKMTAEEAGIEYEEGFEDKKRGEKVKTIRAAKVKKMLDEFDPSKIKDEQPMDEMEETPPEDSMMAEEDTGGFMTRKPTEMGVE